MTREEAIKNIQDFTGWFKKDKPIYEALEMAIQALSQEPCEDCDYSEIMDWEQEAKTGKTKPIYWCERHKEPCDDNRLYIKVYADLEPQEKAEKLYQICEEEELLEVYKELGEYCDIEPCDDVVSRQAVIEIIDEEWLCNAEYEFRPLAEAIEQLPPVRPQEQTGHWIFDEILDKHYYCSECMSMGVDYWDYCPYCGAEMVEPQESEDKG